MGHCGYVYFEYRDGHSEDYKDVDVELTGSIIRLIFSDNTEKKISRDNVFISGFAGTVSETEEEGKEDYG